MTYLDALNQYMAPGASRLSRPLLPGLDFDAPPALQEAWPAEPQALQDHRPRTPEPGPDARRGAPGEEGQAPSPGPLFDRPQGRPPFRDGADRAGEAAHSTRPDGERCPGDGTRGATEPPVSQVTDLLDLSGAAFPRRSQSLRPPSHTPATSAQPAPSKQSLLSFDRPAAPPPEATNSTANEPLARTNASPHQAPTRGAAPRRRPGERLDHVTSPACQRREGEGQRHPRRDPDAQAPRARRAAGQRRTSGRHSCASGVLDPSPSRSFPTP